MKISVITATYNRKYLIHKLYESLVENYKSFKDFEWVIMDDGSNDGTDKIVKKWIKEAKFDIKYYYQENAGKMAAINNVIDKAVGDILTEIDSDDYFLPGVLKMISDDYEQLNDNGVYGIVYKRKIINKETNVDERVNGKVIKLFDLHNVMDYDFDMVLTFKADIRKKYRYELEHNEKFITEARMYYKIDQEYDGMIFKNKDAIVCEYMEDGYSKNIISIFKKYPYGYCEFFKECLGYKRKGLLFRKRLYFVKHYILFSYLTSVKKMDAIKKVNGFNKLLVILLIIPGYIKSKRF